MFSDKMSIFAVAPGTVTLSEMRSTPSTEPRTHIYTKLINNNFGHKYFDINLFYNTKVITMNSNEEHKLLIQSLRFDKTDSTVYRARLDNDELSIDNQHEPGELCYAIKLLTPDVTLTVGAFTSLDLLLKSAHLQVITYVVTKEQAAQLKQPLQERDLVRSQVETVCQASINPNPRKRSYQAPLDIPSGPYVPYRPSSPTTSPPVSMLNI